MTKTTQSREELEKIEEESGKLQQFLNPQPILILGGY